MILRPKLFLFEYFYKYFDYLDFKKSILNLENLKLSISKDSFTENILLVPGKNMNIQWLQLWAVLGQYYIYRGHRVSAITSNNNPIQNKFLKLFNCNLIFLEDLNIERHNLSDDLNGLVNNLNNFDDIKNFEYKGIPIGKMALSTYSRLNLTGLLELDTKESRDEVKYWISYLLKTVFISEKLLLDRKITMLIFTEVFMEEYGSIYYAALKMNLNIIRMAGTVRDNAIVAQHLTEESDRTHFSSFNDLTWAEILKKPLNQEVKKELEQNFKDRYGNKWSMSKRNQPNTKILSADDGKKLVNIPTDKKVAIIYSHILYDTLFFNGEDIYKNYADWLVETVKVACMNENLYWLIKIHPSNVWRGEMNSLTEKGKYEEVRIIEKKIGNLPNHIDYIYPDTPVSPYTWLKIADFGITTRGTSGIELGALGKQVLTAGTGRYEDVGFTINSKTIEEYELNLKNLHKLESSEESIDLGIRFAYATFCLKPFTLDFLDPKPRKGKQEIVSTDDLIYSVKRMTEVPNSLNRFMEWSFKKSDVDFINPWPL
tara:strand:+ start:2153 stop:3778 length:1626 start_codon:yes stop_codon:yes gene_type:complete